MSDLASLFGSPTVSECSLSSIQVNVAGHRPQSPVHDKTTLPQQTDDDEAAGPHHDIRKDGDHAPLDPDLFGDVLMDPRQFADWVVERMGPAFARDYKDQFLQMLNTNTSAITILVKNNETDGPAEETTKGEASVVAVDQGHEADVPAADTTQKHADHPHALESTHERGTETAATELNEDDSNEAFISPLTQENLDAINQPANNAGRYDYNDQLENTANGQVANAIQYNPFAPGPIYGQYYNPFGNQSGNMPSYQSDSKSNGKSKEKGKAKANYRANYKSKYACDYESDDDVAPQSSSSDRPRTSTEDDPFGMRHAMSGPMRGMNLQGVDEFRTSTGTIYRGSSRVSKRPQYPSRGSSNARRANYMRNVSLAGCTEFVPDSIAQPSPPQGDRDSAFQDDSEDDTDVPLPSIETVQDDEDRLARPISISSGESTERSVSASTDRAVAGTKRGRDDDDDDEEVEFLFEQPSKRTRR